MKNILSSILILLCGVNIYAMSVGQQADSAYNAEDYRLAIELYNKSIAEEGKSSDILYNLGNAYYRADKPGKAVVYYQRALRLDPTNEDARTNLEFVQSRIQDRPEDDTAFLSKLHNSLLCSMTANAWAWTAFTMFIVLMGAVALYIFSTNVTMRKTGFFGGIVVLVIFAYTLILASDASTTATSHDTAVVISPTTQLSSAPRAAKTTQDKVVTIHEGTSVEIVDSVPTPDDPVSPMWYNVKINNATKAWLRASDVERI